MDVVERGMKRILIKQHREAPAVFKHQNIYYMVTSGCTGWNPNSAEVHAAESMMGSWETLGDPCVGGDEEFRAFTFFSQGSFVLPLPGLPNIFIFLADRCVSLSILLFCSCWNFHKNIVGVVCCLLICGIRS